MRAGSRLNKLSPKPMNPKKKPLAASVMPTGTPTSSRAKKPISSPIASISLTLTRASS
jgi:hypothetical protein